MPPPSARSHDTRQRLLEAAGEVFAEELLGPGASEDDVRGCVLSIQGQCLFYRHCHSVLTRLFPGVSFGPAQVPELAKHITRFSLAGIRAIARARKAGTK